MIQAEAMRDAVTAIALADASLHAWAFLDERATETVHPGEPLANVAFGVKDIIDVRGMPTRFGIAIDVPPGPGRCLVRRGVASCGRRSHWKDGDDRFRLARSRTDIAPPRRERDARRLERGQCGGGGRGPRRLRARDADDRFDVAIGGLLRRGRVQAHVRRRPGVRCVAACAIGRSHRSGARDVATASAFARVFGIDTRTLDAPPRLAFVADAFADGIGEDVRRALEACVRRCRQAGARLDVIELPSPFFQAFALLEPLIASEAYAVHEPWLDADLPPAFAALLRRGESEPAGARTRALAFRNRTRTAIAAALEPFDAVLLAVADTAPDRVSTGDSRPQAPATFYGLPAISIPTGRSERGLPMGVQILARAGEDASVLAVADWIERTLARSGDLPRPG